MYLEPWQVFLGGCVIGTLIAFIVLTLIVINTINRVGIKGIHIQNLSGGNNNDDDDEEVYTDTDVLAKLSYVLLNRGVITDADVDFMTGHISFDEWKEIVEHEGDDDDENDDSTG